MMPWRLVLFLTSLVLAAFFIGFNLENRCDVSLVLYTFKDVPIVVSLLVAFVAGSLAVIPFVVGHSLRASRPRSRARRTAASDTDIPSDASGDASFTDNDSTKKRPKNFREAKD